MFALVLLCSLDVIAFRAVYLIVCRFFQPLARLGANVTGLDIVPSNISAAQEHSDRDPLIKDKIRYICGDIKDVSSTVWEESKSELRASAFR